MSTRRCAPPARSASRPPFIPPTRCPPRHLPRRKNG
jgi:hypothetical protein